MVRLDFIYGVPGSGKTSLCNAIDAAFYLNLAKSDNYGKNRFLDIFIELYQANKGYSYYIAEACLTNCNIEKRTKLIKALAKEIKADIVNVFYINIDYDDVKDLIKRRGIKTKQYNQILTKVQIGCNNVNHYIIFEKKLDDRVNFIKGVQV